MTAPSPEALHPRLRGDPLRARVGALRRRARARRRVVLGRARGGALPRRRERKRQEHAHQGHRGRLSGRSRRAHRLFRRERRGADSAARARQGRGGDLARPGAFPRNDGRGEHRVRWPRGRAAARELPRHPRNCARRARQARRRARPRRAAQDFADFRQTIGGDRTRARERREAHLHGRAHRLAHPGRDGPPARRRAHALPRPASPWSS